jgi:dTMP kinase
VSGTGRFVVFEGGEGAGKTTQLRQLAEALAGDGWPVTTTAQPGGTPAGKCIRGLLLDPAVTLTGRAEALLYAADRAEHAATVLRPALARGDVVLCDRYSDSSIAYQGAGRALGAPVAELSRWATDGLLPDLVVLLDVDPEVGLARTRVRGPMDRIEQETLDFHQRVRHAFLAQADADPRRYLVLDATAPAGGLSAAIARRARTLLGRPAPVGVS